MLVLSRQREETIMIGDEIEITVVDIRGDKVRLGITAPTRIAVHRKEVYDAIRQENERAAKFKSADLAGFTHPISAGPPKTRSRSHGLIAPSTAREAEPRTSRPDPARTDTSRKRHTTG